MCNLIGALRCAVLVVAAGLLPFQVAGAQTAEQLDRGRLHATRAGLEALLQRFERAASSDTSSEELRRRAGSEAELIRTRLRVGDYQVGDRVNLTVEGEEALADTFTVAPGRMLVLPTIGEIPLAGILRSELEAHLTEHIGQFIRNPVVRAQSLMRMSILGEVSRPGFYVLPANVPLTDALMLAGGPTTEGVLTEIRIERGSDEIWGGDLLQTAITEGRTLDQLNLRAGDRIVVPDQGWDWWSLRNAVLTVSGVLGLAAAIASF